MKEYQKDMIDGWVEAEKWKDPDAPEEVEYDYYEIDVSKEVFTTLYLKAPKGVGIPEIHQSGFLENLLSHQDISSYDWEDGWDLLQFEGKRKISSDGVNDDEFTLISECL